MVVLGGEVRGECHCEAGVVRIRGVNLSKGYFSIVGDEELCELYNEDV